MRSKTYETVSQLQARTHRKVSQRDARAHRRQSHQDIYIGCSRFPTERDTYLHHAQLVRNRHIFYEKIDIYLVEIEKFFAIEDRTPPERREQSDRAEMLRIFRDVLEEKDIPEDRLMKLLDKDFAKDVSLEGYTDITKLPKEKVLKLRTQASKDFASA